MPTCSNFVLIFMLLGQEAKYVRRNEKTVLETKVPDTFRDVLTNILATLLLGKQIK